MQLEATVNRFPVAASLAEPKDGSYILLMVRLWQGRKARRAGGRLFVVRHGRCNCANKLIQAGLCVVLAASAALGQKQHAPAASRTLHVTTRLVQVNVIVKDRQGHLVSGLTRHDFTVLDDGKPQTISVFKVEETKPASVLASNLPAGVFSNIPERQAGSSSTVTVILLDALNTRWADQAYARLQVLKFLQQFQPANPVALYALGLKLRVLHDFTTDTSALEQAAAAYRGEALPLVTASEKPTGSLSPLAAPTNAPGEKPTTIQQEFAEAVAESDRRSANAAPNYYMGLRVELTTSALIAIANHLQGVPGRKNLIWVSGGFPMWRALNQALSPGGFDAYTLQNTTTFDTADVRDYGPELARAAEALNNDNLAIYPVAAQGLEGNPEQSASNGSALPGSMTTTRVTLPSLTTPSSAPIQVDNFQMMDDLAKRTGGRAFYNTNDLQGAVRQVIHDTRLTYALGYYPKFHHWHGQYRRIQVKVDRPGLQLEYRLGYMATPERPPTAPAGEEALNAAVSSPLDATGVGVKVRLVLLETDPNSPRAVRVFYWIDTRDISLTSNKSRTRGSLSVVLAELSAQGKNLRAWSHTTTLDLDPATYETFLAHGMNGNKLLPVVPKAERVRVVVRDDSTGRTGSVTVPLDRVFPHPQGR